MRAKMAMGLIMLSLLGLTPNAAAIGSPLEPPADCLIYATKAAFFQTLNKLVWETVGPVDPANVFYYLFYDEKGDERVVACLL